MPSKKLRMQEMASSACQFVLIYSSEITNCIICLKSEKKILRNSHFKRYLMSCANCKNSDQVANPRYRSEPTQFAYPAKSVNVSKIFNQAHPHWKKHCLFSIRPPLPLWISSPWEALAPSEANSLRAGSIPEWLCRQGKQTKSHKSRLSLCKMAVKPYT